MGVCAAAEGTQRTPRIQTTDSVRRAASTMLLTRRPRAFSLDERHDLLHRHVAPHFLVAVRPADLHTTDPRRLPETCFDAKIILRVVAAAAAHLAHQRRRADDDADAGADGGAVRGGADELELGPRRRWARVETVEIRRFVYVVDRNVDVAVVVDVAERGAAPGVRCGDRWPEPLRQILESPVAQVAIDDLPLLIRRLGLDLLDLRVDVAIDQEQIEPAVEIEIEEADTPAEPARVEADAAREGAVLAQAVAAVRVERRRVAGEIGLEDVDRAVAIVVAEREPHPGLRLAVLAVSTAGRHGNVFERAVALVPIERARVRIVRHVQIDPPVIVEVERADAEAVGARGLRDPGFFRDVLEHAVSLVAIHDVFAAVQSRRSACDRHPLVTAQARVGHWRGLEVEVDVVGGEEIEQAVAIDVEERAAGAPARRRQQAGAGGDILERTVAAVVEQAILPPERDVEIVVAVVVVVAGARALSPPAERDSRLRGDVFERAVAAVAIEVAGRRLAWREPFERRPVDEEQIDVAVVVVVEHRDAAAGGLQQV